MAASYPEEIEVAQYLIERIKQVGVKQIFGLPGDYNLEFLDYIESDPVLNWVGNANELNASYAADGYARIRRNLAVLVTTFGVGELSALNGVAGCMAERIPLLHLVGAPSTRLQSMKATLHHTLGNGSFSTFSAMSAHISAAVGNLTPADKGKRLCDEIDRVIKVALIECRPVYLSLPTDLVHTKVPSESLKTLLPTAHSAPPRLIDPSPSRKIPHDILDHVVAEIVHMFEHAKKPIVIVDVCTQRFGCGQGVMEMVEGTGMRFFETPMGKATLAEQHPLYGGAYIGANSLPSIRKEVEEADFVLMCGRLESDFNSGSFTFDLPIKNTVELHSFTTKIGFASYPETDMRAILPILSKALIEVVKKHGGPKAKDESLLKQNKEERAEKSKVPENPGTEIRHKWLWPRVQKFLKEDDVVIAETGTSSFGIVNVPFPSSAACVVQVLWGSIGWATGAALGVALGAQESGKQHRIILFTGEGSMQLSIQEIGTMIRRKLNPYIFVLNNDGYEIERQIHGEKAEYNNIQMYDHQKLLETFAGASKHPRQSYVVKTPAELDALLKDPEFNVPDRIRLIEMYMPRGDAPETLLGQAKLTAAANAKI